MGEVVSFEKNELEQKRFELIHQINEDQNQLLELEDQILKLLGEVKSKILDDD